eukprot:c13462_g1_i3 orf=1-186(-)
MNPFELILGSLTRNSWFSAHTSPHAWTCILLESCSLNSFCVTTHLVYTCHTYHMQSLRERER